MSANLLRMAATMFLSMLFLGSHGFARVGGSVESFRSSEFAKVLELKHQATTGSEAAGYSGGAGAVGFSGKANVLIYGG